MNLNWPAVTAGQYSNYQQKANIRNLPRGKWAWNYRKNHMSLEII